LVERKRVVPGKSAASPARPPHRRRVHAAAGEKPWVSDADLATLKAWIDAGRSSKARRPARPSPPTTVTQLVLADLEKFDRRARRFQRYFTLAHLHNAGLSDDELQTYRNALAKLVNSLSWHPKIRNPEPIDPAKTVLRIDLRWFVWDADAVEPRSRRLPLRRAR
jgi:hypothetical protein